MVLALLWLLGVCAGGADKVRLRDIGTLTFHRNSYTSTRHGSSIPELSCVGGSALKYVDYHPRSVQCYNRGYDGRDVQWECKAQLDKAVRFGSTTVNCEGYSHPNDDYVLVGSCGLEYELELVSSKPPSPSYVSFLRLPPVASLRYFSPYLILAILVTVALAIWYFCLRDVYRSSESYYFTDRRTPVEPSAPPDYPPPRYDDVFRGNGHSFEDYSTRHRSSAPPPPSSPPHYGWDGPSSRRNYGSGSSKCNTEPSTSWMQTGLAAGAGFLGGYLFGSSDRHRTQANTTRAATRNRVYPEFSETDDSFASAHVEPCSSTTPAATTSRSGDRAEPYVATTFAKTKRR